MNAVNHKRTDFKRGKFYDVFFQPVFAFQRFFAKRRQFQAACGNPAAEIFGIEIQRRVADVFFKTVVGIIDGNDVKGFFQKFRFGFGEGR